ncbi:MAG: isopentenyl-diphosphate delta-isomerase [Bacteroidota bacterium]
MSEVSSSVLYMDNDPTAEERKKDHIELAFQSQVEVPQLDPRFYYEPLFAAHPTKGTPYGSIPFLGKTMRAPVWVSSMTGGTKMANTINHNLAKVCGEFGMGMGLGSCRALLYSDEYLKDFAVRSLIGEDNPLYANLGVAQLQQLIDSNELYRIYQLLDKLEADGLIIHINPFQEWMQPEGDIYTKSPLETIETILEKMDVRIIVKEVGQGMGYESLKTLLQMPLEAVDFAASGGTNFSMLELLRSDAEKKAAYTNLAHVGHSAAEMVKMCNQLKGEVGDKMRCQQLIISGGVKDFLDGYYLIEKANFSAVYGQASGFLKHAQGSYEQLYQHVERQIEGLKLAKAYLKVR